MTKTRKAVLRKSRHPEPATWSLSHSAAVVGVNKELARRFVNNGTWTSFRINNKIYVYRDALLKWVEAQSGNEISA
jgi:hypothetical protein